MSLRFLKEVIVIAINKIEKDLLSSNNNKKYKMPKMILKRIIFQIKNKKDNY